MRLLILILNLSSQDGHGKKEGGFFFCFFFVEEEEEREGRVPAGCPTEGRVWDPKTARARPSRGPTIMGDCR